MIEEVQQARKGKTGVFSYNPDQAMDWLFTNKNVFTLLSYILFRKNKPEYLYPNANNDLKINETFIILKKIKIKPIMTQCQINRALINLEYWGFIEILDFKPVFRSAGTKKINILVNIFDPTVIKHIEDFRNTHGHCFFNTF